ncbi:unnamed protein product [Larinioides sclopetarius]|uniref:Protein kinase domain-containing protein n=1 Tax=Larinioides sclopetarius TaxID=280406 RepID=A0AAV1ZBG6_9ARAC
METRFYIAMEYAPNGTIADYFQRHGSVDEAVARSWIKQLCIALRYLHGKNLAHRDVKCNNMLLNERNEIKLIDFDFLCHTRDATDDQMILSFTYCGSPAYLAPEVLEGKPYAAVPADVWSAVVCAFVILNNKVPFTVDNPERIREAQLRWEWDFNVNVKKRLSLSARRVVARMMDPNPKDRPTVENVLTSNWLKSKEGYNGT